MEKYINEAHIQLSNNTFHGQLDFDPSDDYAGIIIIFLNDLKGSKSINDELATFFLKYMKVTAPEDLLSRQ